MPARPALLAWLALFASSGCSLLLDADSLTGGPTNPSSGGAGAGQGSSGAAGSSGAGTAGESAAAAGAVGDAGAAGQGTSACTEEVPDTCDGLDGDCRATLDEPNCPVSCDGVVINGTSYMACSQGATWSDAEVLCQAQGMHLIRVDDGAENNVTVELARGLGSYVWLGGSSLISPGSYAWVDGTEFYADGAAVEGVYQNFETGQPVEGAGRNCVQLHDSAEGPWSNAPCNDVKPYVCERF